MLGVPFSSEPAKRLSIPHGSVTPLWDTTIYASNPKEKANVVRFELVNNYGNLVTAGSFRISPNGSRECSPDNVLSGNFNGSLNNSAQYPIVAFATFGNTKKDLSGTFLAGIGAIVVQESTEVPDEPEPPPEITMKDLVGYYELDSFEVKYDSGVTTTSRI